MVISKMLTPKQLYSELLSLTQIFLLREHQINEKIRIEQQSYRSLRPHLLSSKELVAKKSEQPLLSKPVVMQTMPVKPPQIAIEAKEPPLPPPAPPPVIVTQPAASVMEIKAPESPTASEVKEKKILTLEPLQPPAIASVDVSYKKFFSDHFPHFSLSDNIPSDRLAKREKEAWQQKKLILPVILLSFHEDAQSLAFMKNIAKAISLRLAPASVLNGVELEKESRWDEILSTPDLKLIISSDYGLYLQPGLMKFYRQDTKSGAHSLNHLPLLLLSDLSLYLRKPELKALLWNAICNEFAGSKGI